MIITNSTSWDLPRRAEHERKHFSSNGPRRGAAVAGGLLLKAVHVRGAEGAKKRVVVWSEGTAPKKIYPKDINTVVAEGLQKDLDGWDIVIANLSDADQGLNDERLNSTDVLVWWGHQRHGQVKDDLVKKIVKRVKEDAMGFISLHSSHFAKPNMALMGFKPTDPDVLAKVQPKNRVAAWGAYLGDSVTLKIIVKDKAAPDRQGRQGFRDSAPRALQQSLRRAHARFAGVRRRVHDEGWEHEPVGAGLLLDHRQGQDVLLPAGTRDRPGVLRSEDPDHRQERRAVGGEVESNE